MCCSTKKKPAETASASLLFAFAVHGGLLRRYDDDTLRGEVFAAPLPSPVGCDFECEHAVLVESPVSRAPDQSQIGFSCSSQAEVARPDFVEQVTQQVDRVHLQHDFHCAAPASSVLQVRDHDACCHGCWRCVRHARPPSGWPFVWCGNRGEVVCHVGKRLSKKKEPAIQLAGTFLEALLPPEGGLCYFFLLVSSSVSRPARIAA